MRLIDRRRQVAAGALHRRGAIVEIAAHRALAVIEIEACDPRALGGSAIAA
jgi:hypothetical protein